jgi:hypothetical protein
LADEETAVMVATWLTVWVSEVAAGAVVVRPAIAGSGKA